MNNNLLLEEIKINKENNLLFHDKWFYICDNDPNLYVCENFCNSVEKRGRFWYIGRVVSVNNVLFKPKFYYQTLEGPYPSISSAAKRCVDTAENLNFPGED